MKIAAIILSALCFLASTVCLASRYPDAEHSEYVNGYTKQDGRYVEGYYRGKRER